MGSAVDEASEHENDVPGMPESQDTVIDGEFTEIPETEEDIRDPEEPLTELQIAQEELERAKKLLNDGLKCDVDENDIHIRRLKIKVCALAAQADEAIKERIRTAPAYMYTSLCPVPELRRPPKGVIVRGIKTCVL